MGTLMIELKIPYSPRTSQKGLPFLSNFIVGLLRGIEYLPTERRLEGLPIFVEESSGR